jgi:hypothetical protein
LLGGFTWELATFKAEFHTFSVSAVADFAELVLSCHATNTSIWTCIALHFWAFLAGDSTNTDSHLTVSIYEKL